MRVYLFLTLMQSSAERKKQVSGKNKMCKL